MVQKCSALEIRKPRRLCANVGAGRPVRPSVPRLRFLALAMAKASDYSDVSPLGNNQLLHQLMPQKRLVDTP